MRKYLFLLFLLSFSLIKAQTEVAEKDEVNVVKEFFKAFHEQDTIKMKEFVAEKTTLKSIIKDQNGSSQLKTETFPNFLKSLSSIPENMKFEEVIDTYESRSDNFLAVVWTPYHFYVNGELSHCGVNNFQLMNTKEGWKIFSITDTRRIQGCTKPKK